MAAVFAPLHSVEDDGDSGSARHLNQHIRNRPRGFSRWSEPSATAATRGSMTNV
jgi:hypothetical protein